MSMTAEAVQDMGLMLLFISGFMLGWKCKKPSAAATVTITHHHYGDSYYGEDANADDADWWREGKKPEK